MTKAGCASEVGKFSANLLNWIQRAWNQADILSCLFARIKNQGGFFF